MKATLKEKSLLWFLLPSLIGIFLFISPISYQGGYTILIAIFAQAFQSSLTGCLSAIITLTISLSFLLSAIFRWIPKRIQEIPVIRIIGMTTFFWFLMRALAFIFALMTYYKVGLPAVFSESTGSVLLNDLLPTIFCVFLFAGVLLPLLIDFGLLEFMGVMARKVMKPLFTLPGRASIDCIASWLGDGTIGILLTNKQYISKHYTAREAAVVATTFSFVSLSFSLVIISEVNLSQYVIPFYLTVVLVGIICAIIMPRIPPLSLKKDEFIDGTKSNFNAKSPNSSINQAWQEALKRTEKRPTFLEFINSGIHNVFEMWFAVIPTVMAMGTLALMVAEYTPFFEWLGAPFIPLLKILKIPFPVEASEAVMIGFADMFLPTVLAKKIDSDLTRFVIATLSVSQLIFMSEVGGLLLGAKLPIKIWDLILIFILRTLIALPIIAIVAHQLF